MSESETDIEFVSDMEWLHSHDREAALPPEKLIRLFALARRGADAAAEIKRLRETLDSAYNERNRLVAFLARLFPSGLKYTAIPGWDEGWHGCVYIDLPTGQASWHYHDREAYLFDGLPPYSGDWDGHSTGLKYLRIARAALKEDGARAALDASEAECTALRAEIERLRAALDKMKRSRDRYRQAWEAEKARAALKEEGE